MRRKRERERDREEAAAIIQGQKSSRILKAHRFHEKSHKSHLCWRETRNAKFNVISRSFRVIIAIIIS